ncbi:MAG: glycosyltransferase family 9 protein [Crocinitomicaceae bacterium]|nr:glycosyltransferase family 9 protein [Crocinitomicaceae bacterium]
MDLNNKNVIISRTDSIGDVMLTLPICAWLKEQWPEVNIIFLGKGYTKSIVEAYDFVDKFEDWNDYLNLPKTDKIQAFRKLEADVIIHVFPDKEIASLAKKARIGMRIGTSHRAYHLLTCSHRVSFTRRKSNLHESQLNHELLRPHGLKEIPSLDEIVKSTANFKVNQVELPKTFKNLKDFTILHPKSQGSAKEWPLEKYMELAKILSEQGEQVVFTGTEAEGKQFRDVIPENENAIDSTGKLSLEQLMVLIQNAKNLVACSTGPLHIAGYLGVNAVGLYSPKRPIHPDRWKALGKHVQIIVFDENCEPCSKLKDCDCVLEIEVDRVLKSLN